jgi:hypothetical protein
MNHMTTIAADESARGSPQLRTWTFYLLLAFAGIYLLSPIVDPAHPEGFTASVASLALHLRQDSLANFDLSQPLNVDFFGLTKLGWMLLIAATTAVTGLGSWGAMTVLNWLAFVPFTLGTVFLVRRWTEAPVWAIVAVLLLLPGVSESFFFFNDNAIASAFAISALCTLYLRTGMLGASLCGLLMGAAVLTRTDTVLVGMAVPIIAFERTRKARPTLAMLAVAGAAGALVLFGTLAFFHAAILDVFKVAGFAVAAWDRETSQLAMVATLLHYFGAPGLVLAISGGVIAVRRSAWLATARLLLPPLVFMAPLWGKLWEVRQLLPLTPFFASLAVIALLALVRGASTRRTAVLRASFVGLTGASLLGTTTGFNLADGPRVLTGRVWNIPKWHRWQRLANADLARLGSLAAIPLGTTRAVIADNWNEDRYAHLAFQEAGYKITRRAPGPCATVADVFVRGSSRIVLIRLHQGYVPYWPSLSPERLERWGLPCMAERRPADIYLAVQTQRFDALFGDPDAPEDPTVLPEIRTLRLAPQQLGMLLDAYRADARRAAEETEVTGTLDEAVNATAKRTGFGR